MDKWYQKANNTDEDVVISSRIRLARNLRNYNFQERLADEDATRLVEEMCALKTELSGREGQKFISCSVNRQSETERTSMVEWHIISPQLCRKRQETGVILSDDESVSIMVNEEDHLRLQAVCSGFDMKNAWKIAGRIDDFFEQRVEYAYSEKYGYLTSCPTNVGTGLRASYMLFLPALTLGQMIDKLSDEVAKYGVVIRGMYGEGSKSRGFIYQVSNQKTLGCSETDIIVGLSRVVLQIVDQERRCRLKMLETDFEDIEDKVYRSYGVLKYSKLLTTQDAMTLLAQLKLGIDLKLIKCRSANGPFIHKLMMEIQPATMQKLAGRALGSDERKRYRADYLNRNVPEIEK